MPSSNHRSTKTPRILLLEDSSLDAELVHEHLGQLDPAPDIRRAVNRADYIAALDEIEFDVILSDFSLPDFDGMAALEIARERLPGTPFIFVSGVLGEEAAIESFRRGATDYVLKQRLIRLPAAVERALAEAHEKAERRRSDMHRELLVRELSHRVKNTMAMVMSIVRRTAKNSSSVEGYVDNLMGRLRAMADAHALLFETNWNEASLADVVQRTMTAYVRSPDRINLTQGPPTPLDPKAALATSMVLNELVTNALKYGCLSSEHGRVFVSWSHQRDADCREWVRLTWREVGGPTVRVPEEPGFGTTLIQRMVEYELLGDVALGYAETGLTCEIRFPFEQRTGDVSEPAAEAFHASRRKGLKH